MPLLLPCGATIAEPGDQPGDLITGVRQIEWNGLLLGSGTPYQWKQLTGWDTMPGLDLADTDRPADHGAYPGRGLYQSRTVALTATVNSDADFTEELIALLRARTGYGDVEQPLIIADAGATLWAACRVINRDITHEKSRTQGIHPASVQWKASFPARYGLDEHTLTLTPGTATGGLTYPLTYPLDYGTPSGGSTGVVSNGGEAPCVPTVVVSGPASAGFGVLTGDGRFLGLDLALAVGETATFDTRDGTVMINDTSDRTSFLSTVSVPPELWRLDPGDTTVQLIVPAGAAAGTQAQVTWSDTYW